MNRKKINSGLSRRKFLKGVGSGITGAYVLPVLTTEAAKLPKEIQDSLEGNMKFLYR